MNKLLKLAGALSVCSCLVPVARAGAYCTEHVTQVIISGDSIYFTTDKSCPTWCSVDSTWSVNAQNRAYAALLTAQATQNAATFYWNDQASACSSTEATYSVPTVVMP